MTTHKRQVTFKGSPLTVIGRELKVGDILPRFKLTANDLSDLDNSSFRSKTLIISVVPSLDTPVCSIQTKRFNNALEKLPSDVACLTVSMDLPFAQARWCGAEGASRVVTASDHKYRGFGEDFGTYIQELGLLSRAVFVVDKSDLIKHVEYVQEITSEPDYDSALNVAKNSL